MARPKKDDARDDGFRVRLNKQEREMLNYIRYEKDCSAAEVFRVWLRTEYIKTRSQKAPD